MGNLSFVRATSVKAMAGVRDFEIIVVGAGASGAPLAARASENPNTSVLLLDAGPDYSDLTDTPADLRNGHHNSVFDHDWQLDDSPTEQRPNQPLPRGRVTGGSSAVNTCIFLRGVPEDYDDWADRGNSEWRWENVLPTFCRIERDLDFGDESFHGDAGPITVRRYPYEELTELHQAFLATAEELGYPECPDQNDPDGWGAGPQPMNKLGQLRVSTASAYLAPIRLRPNLEIRGGCHTNKLIIERGKAVGVEIILADGSIEQIRSKLVVLCAGAIHTPGILLRSGIGPSQHLAQMGVDVSAEMSGVGKNLSDHPGLFVLCRPTHPELVNSDQPIIQTILRYTSPDNNDRMDLQIEQLTFTGRENVPYFGVAAVLEQVDGVGELIFPDADPFVNPTIRSRFCEVDRDAERLADCFFDALRFTETGPLGALTDEVMFPDLHRVNDRADVIDLLRRFSASGYHPSGTARMGPSDDPEAVVDQYGRCHSIDGLVVADASIFPTVPRANTNPSSIMVGETIGEWLRTEPSRYSL